VRVDHEVERRRCGVGAHDAPREHERLCHVEAQMAVERAPTRVDEMLRRPDLVAMTLERLPGRAVGRQSKSPRVVDRRGQVGRRDEVAARQPTNAHRGAGCCVPGRSEPFDRPRLVRRDGRRRQRAQRGDERFLESKLDGVLQLVLKQANGDASPASTDELLAA
jgi:hypothetical protein